jgi:uncharacterized membrane protein
MAMISATETSSTGLSPRVAAPLAYAGWWVTGAILWFVERRDHSIRFHAAQSVAAFGAIAAAIAAFGALALASLSFLPSAFTLFLWAAAITWGLGVVLWIVAIWKAAAGRAWRIPVAADLADRLMQTP